MKSLPCNLCGTETSHQPFLAGGQDWEYGVPGTFTQGQCTVCGLVRMDPMPSLAEIGAYYPASYHGYQSPASPLTRWLIQRNLRKRARAYKRLIGSTGTILDVGAADGAHFDVWKQEGHWTFNGFEFNDAIAQEGRVHGRNIATATMETFDSRGQQFDLIIMNHLLEHVVNPRQTVQRAYELLKPGGWIVGETPNIRSLDRMIAGRYWGGCHWPRHVHQFMPSSMRALLRSAGFTQVRITPSLDTSHWALSVQNALQASVKTRIRIHNGRTMYYPWLLAAFVPLNIVQYILGITGILGFAAQKPVEAPKNDPHFSEHQTTPQP